MTQKPARSFDSRTFRGRLERELILGGTLVGLIVGGGLITLIWGVPALLVALGCFAGFLGLVGLVWGFLKIVEVVSRD
jgi:hypothetical protein